MLIVGKVYVTYRNQVLVHDTYLLVGPCEPAFRLEFMGIATEYCHVAMIDPVVDSNNRLRRD